MKPTPPPFMPEPTEFALAWPLCTGLASPRLVFGVVLFVFPEVLVS
jgi:hypothetical protein